jgi:hypothetical protein
MKREALYPSPLGEGGRRPLVRAEAGRGSDDPTRLGSLRSPRHPPLKGREKRRL